MAYADAFDDYPASSRRGCARPAGCWPTTARSTSTSTRARPLRQGAARRALRPRVLPQRARSGPTTTAPSRARRWPAKHDTILVYVKDPERYHFDDAEVDREPYMAPGLVDAREGGARQAADRRVVAHDRPDQRQREDRLPDAEAAGRSCGGWSRRRRGRAAGAWTSSPAPARSAPRPRRWAGASCWSTRRPTRSTSASGASAALRRGRRHQPRADDDPLGGAVERVAGGQHEAAACRRARRSDEASAGVVMRVPVTL